MMERLTQRSVDRFKYDLINADHSKPEFSDYDAFYNYSIAVSKLGEYEDAEEKGLLLILPVAPGETVYLIDNNTDACDECENFVVGYCEEYCKCNDAEYPQCAEEPLCEKQFLEVIEYKTNQKWILENKDDFGKRIFLTREEAEAALKKMQEGKE